MKHGTKREQEQPVLAARMTAVTTEKLNDKHVLSLYARTWMLAFIWGDALLVLIRYQSTLRTQRWLAA